MLLSTGDLLATILALVSLNTVLVLAFRRIYILEKQTLKLRRELRK